jgi:hypothetical protein
MSVTKLILVLSTSRSAAMAPFDDVHRTLDLDVDPDNALAGICAYFAERWDAKVHALRWIFPDDLLLPGDDRTPYLVLHLNTRGSLVSQRANDRQSRPQRNSQAHRDPLLSAATRPCRSEPWSNPLWLAETSEWVDVALMPGKSRRISQIRVCANGAVLKLEIAGGTYFLKTLPPSFSYEVDLLRYLDGHSLGICPAVLAPAPNDRTHITHEVDGKPLRNIDDRDQWAGVLRQLAEFQVRSVAHVDQIKSIGIPHQSLSDFAANLDRLINGLVRMQKGAGNELVPRELDHIPCLIEDARRATEILSECGIPEALVHGDLNESNIFVGSAGRATLIDWTFSRISHPFFALGFSLFQADHPSHRMHGSRKILRDAYAAPWRDYSCPDRLLAGIEAASRLFWVDTAQDVGRFVMHSRKTLPGAVCHLPVVLRRTLSSFGFVA